MNKVLILAGGPLINESYLREVVGTFDKILCADSGADYAYKIGLIPDIVFGDLDSISGKALEYMNRHDVEIDVFPVEKDMTDSELCLSFVTKELDPEKIVIVSSLKGRFDQTLSNAQMALAYSTPSVPVIFTDGDTFVYPLLSDSPVKFNVNGSEVISIIPASPVVSGVQTSGLYYELSGQDLHHGSSFSVSNKPKNTKAPSVVTVSCNGGSAYVIVGQ